MNPTDEPDIEPEDTGNRSDKTPTKKSGSRRSLNNLRRELSDDELKSPAVQKLLIDDIERLEREEERARDLSEKYHASDKKSGILEEKLTTARSTEVLHIACITIGGVALGAASNTWILGAIGGVLIVAGIIAKAIKL